MIAFSNRPNGPTSRVKGLLGGAVSVYSLFSPSSLEQNQNMILSVRNGGRVRRFCASSTVERFLQESYMSNQVVTFNMKSQLRCLIDSGNLEAARQMFDKMPQRDTVSLTSIIKGYVKATKPEEALLLFSAMRVDPDVSVDSSLLSVTLKACGQSYNLAYGQSLHAYAVKTPLLSSVYVGTALLGMYIRIGNIEESIRVFSEMPYRNAFTWTTIIKGLVDAGRHKEGLMYFSEMSRMKELSDDTYAFPIALKACAGLRQVKYGKQIHTHVVVKGFGTILWVANSLTTMYTECGEMQDGLRFFESMSEKDVVTWTSLITAYGRMEGQEEKAVKTFLQMRHSQVPPNEQTFATMFSVCKSLSRLAWGEQLHGNVFSLGLGDYLSVSNSMMKMYSTCGKLDSASVLFQEMRCRDIISWSTIIGGYSQAGFGEEGFKYFSWMGQAGPKPTDCILASLLSVSGTMAVLEQGRQVHALALYLGLEHKSMIRSALINMYSKCGSIIEASQVLEETDNYDIVSLTAMMNGFAEHGMCKEAIDLFEKSLKLGFRPDAVSFISILTACNHSGQLDIGFHYFNLMKEKYNIRPEKEHYGCMVDLLCRARQLGDAENLINEMPWKKDDVVWTTLLRACRDRGDIERGKRAAERILELDPTSDIALVTLANIYSRAGQWEEAANVRKNMNSKGVIKEPGYSAILIKDQFSSFVSGDRFHPHCEDINSILKLVASGAQVRRNDCAIKKAFGCIQICDPS